MNILLLGAAGQLGMELCRYREWGNLNLISFSRTDLDITDYASLKSCIRVNKPNVIINTAAYTKVDLAEKEQALAYAINAEAVGHLAKICNQEKIPLIHLSTDYVFDGKKKQAYCEEDIPNPLSVYGKSKFLGEERIKEYLEQHVILRVSWIYGYYGHNFVKTILKLAQEREELNIVNDQYGCPTAALDIANVIYQIVKLILSEKITFGIYHYCNRPKTTWYEFANQIILNAKLNKDLKVKSIIPIQTDDFPTLALRPKNSELSIQKITKLCGIMSPSWNELLPLVIKELCQ